MIRVEAKSARTPEHVATGEIIAPFDYKSLPKAQAKLAREAADFIESRHRSLSAYVLEIGQTRLAIFTWGQHMKRLAIAIVVSLTAFETSAVVRYLVKDMTCAEVQQAIDRDGVAILYRQATSSGLPIYDRYVKSDDFCDSGQNISRASVPTAVLGWTPELPRRRLGGMIAIEKPERLNVFAHSGQRGGDGRGRQDIRGEPGSHCGRRAARASLLRRRSGAARGAHGGQAVPVMKPALIAAAFCLVATGASAEPRYDITNMACATVQALVTTEGAVILSYRSSSILGLPNYDRYVGNRQYCRSNEVMRQAGVPTPDKKYCPVRKCVESQIFISR